MANIAGLIRPRAEEPWEVEFCDSAARRTLGEQNQ